MRFRVFQRRNWKGKRQWYFRGQSDRNNRTLFPSEGYNNLQDALDTIELIRGEAASATVHIEEKL